VLVAVLLSALLGAGTAGPVPASPHPDGTDADLTALVNPFIGTENEGLDIPAAGAPFGMAQEVPLVATDSGGTGCDTKAATRIAGFGQSTVNGCRFNYVPMLPTTGPITSTDPAEYAQRFDHADEQARPDYYRVRLGSGTTAELTATTRTGWQRYTFPRTGAANVLFNTGAGVSASSIHIVGDRTVEGWVADSRRTYFVARLSRPFTGHGTWSGSGRRPGSRESTGNGDNGGWVSIDTRHDDTPVVVKTGLSYTGLAGARRNLAAETSGYGFDFDAAHRALHERWNAMLHRVEISGGAHDQRVAFYTALYHATLDPNVIGDVDGRYLGFDGTVHRADGFTPYSNLSLWDTYRTQNQLIELLAPHVARDVDLSILAIARQDGWLPRWYLGNQEGNIMTGDPITPYLVEGWSKGLLSGAAAEQAYRYVRANATRRPPATAPQNGRAAVDQYAKRGYIPYGLHVANRCPTDGAACCPTHGNDNDCYYPVSTALEYSSADASLALMARGLGHPDDAAMFARRGQWYHHLYDTRIGLFRPRTADGTWLRPYHRGTGEHAFHEGDPAQYQWLVPQDPAGLTEMLGGRAATTERLDRFFAYDELRRDPAGTARTAWVRDPYDYYGPTTYNPNNEIDLLAPYQYAWTGQPGHTATVVRAAETLFTNSPTGIPGNDDMGEMSSWYVLSSLGLYPTMSGANFYVVTTPQFDRAIVHIGRYRDRQGGTLRIAAPGSSMRNRYIAAATVNGKPWNRSWVGQGDIAHGGRIDYTLSSTPTGWATAPDAAPPSVDTVADPTSTVDASLSPGQSIVEPSATGPSRQRLTLTTLATDPGTATVRVTTAAPDGWSVSPRSRAVPVESGGLPTEARVPITVTAPPGTAPGRYAVEVTVTMHRTSVRRTAMVTVGRPGRCAYSVGTSCAVDLSGGYDRDGVATPDQPGAGDFDGNGASYAADLLPAPGRTTLDGVPYQAPPTSGTAPNFVTADGRSLALPAGRYGSLDILGAATDGGTGSAGGTAVVTYADGSTASVRIELSDWGADDPSFGNGVALDMPYRIGTNGKDDTPVSLYRTTVPLDDSKQVRSVTLAEPSVPQWVEPGLTGTAWDHDTRVRIYAMTLTG